MRFVLILFLLLGSIAPAVFAQNNSSPTAVPTTPPARHSDYSLVYPGILPNNPLYPIKMIRDRIVLFLIADPAKRATFNLLQSDKRVAAGALLLEEDTKNEALAITTIKKGENYFHEALNQAFQLKREGREVNGFIQKLSSAVEKHMQVIGDLKKKVTRENGEKLAVTLAHLKGYQKLLNASQ